MQIEYEIKSCKNERGHNNTEEGDGCLDVKRASIPMKSGGYLIYAVTHQHAGAIGSTLYGQVCNLNSEIIAHIYSLTHIYIY